MNHSLTVPAHPDEYFPNNLSYIGHLPLFLEKICALTEANIFIDFDEVQKLLQSQTIQKNVNGKTIHYMKPLADKLVVLRKKQYPHLHKDHKQMTFLKLRSPRMKKQSHVPLRIIIGFDHTYKNIVLLDVYNKTVQNDLQQDYVLKSVASYYKNMRDNTLSLPYTHITPEIEHEPDEVSKELERLHTLIIHLTRTNDTLQEEITEASHSNYILRQEKNMLAQQTQEQQKCIQEQTKKYDALLTQCHALSKKNTELLSTQSAYEKNTTALSEEISTLKNDFSQYKKEHESLPQENTFELKDMEIETLKKQIICKDEEIEAQKRTLQVRKEKTSLLYEKLEHLSRQGSVIPTDEEIIQEKLSKVPVEPKTNAQISKYTKKVFKKLKNIF